MTQEEVRKYLRRLNLIFYGIIALPLLAFCYLYLEDHAGRLQNQFSEDTSLVFLYVLPIFILVVLGYSLILSGSRIKKIDPNRDLQSRLMELQSNLLVRYGAFEGSSIFVLILYYFTAEKLYAILYVVTLMLYSLNRPTAHRIITNLNLKGEEKELFNKVSL